MLSAGLGLLRSGQLAPLLPANKFNGAVQYSQRRFSASLSAMIVGRRYASAARTATLGGYPLLTLQTGWKAGRRLSLFALVDNLLDRRYEVLPGYIMPRINAAGGFSFSF